MAAGNGFRLRPRVAGGTEFRPCALETRRGGSMTPLGRSLRSLIIGFTLLALVPAPRSYRQQVDDRPVTADLTRPASITIRSGGWGAAYVVVLLRRVCARPASLFRHRG